MDEKNKNKFSKYFFKLDVLGVQIFKGVAKL
jgi:hypothetical protein